MDNQLSFGRWLKVCRVALRLTQAELAERTGYSTVTIRKLESDDLRPSLPIVERLADQLALPPQDRPAFIRFARGEAGGDALRLPPRMAGVHQPAPPSHLPMQARSHTLPTARTPLIGRTREVDDVKALLVRQDVRLVTLTGPGGIGKTRLAVQVASDLPSFDDGICFVDLAPIREPGLVAAAIAQALDIRPAPGQPLQDSLQDDLRDKQFLLLLDNFEQVIAAAAFVAELLAACPGLTLLVTSREALRLRGEKQYPVPPLQAPHPDRLLDADRLAQYPAAALFLQRAQDVKPDFCLTDENAPAVAAICACLDGLPLAIELAAARTKMLPPEALLQRLSNRLHLLRGGARDLPARQQTLRGAIDWSYRLLEPAEQTLFARLAVFLGGRTLVAVDAVCNAAGDLGIDPFDGVASLLDKSLLRREEGSGDEPRFVMLETIHDYARERLELSGEAEVLRQRHAAYFRQVAEVAVAEFGGAHPGAARARLATEQDNLRAALRWALDRREGETALWLAIALGDSCYASGQLSERRQWLEAALAMTQSAQATGPDAGPASVVRAKALDHAAWDARLQGDYREARLRFEEALALNRARADTQAIARSLILLGIIANDQGDFATSRELNAEAFALQRELGDPVELARMLNDEGWQAYLYAGDDARALPLLEESLALLRQMGDTTSRLGAALHGLGTVLIAHTDYARAGALLTEGLRLAHHHGNRSQVMWYLEGLAWLAAPEGMAQGAPVEGAQRAAHLFGAAEALWETNSELLSPGERSVHERHVAIARAQVDETAWQVAWAEGRAMPLEQAIAYALDETEN